MFNNGQDADEETVFALLVASERIGGWLDCIRQRQPGCGLFSFDYNTCCPAHTSASSPPGRSTPRAGSSLRPERRDHHLGRHCRRWKTAVRELRKAVEAHHTYAEEVTLATLPAAQLCLVFKLLDQRSTPAYGMLLTQG